MKNKFAIFIISLAAILGIAGFWYYQKNIYSKEALKLEISAYPQEVDLLEEIEYLVEYTNNGNVRLEEAELIFRYPKFSMTEKGTLIEKIPLDDIYPGQTRSHRFKARLMGKEGELKEAKATLSYRPKNLQAFYEAETTFSTRIKKAPLTFEFDLPSRIESGREIGFKLNYFSNVNYPLSGLGIKVEYPSGFEFIKSTPQSLGETEWDIGLLNTTEGGRIEITGKLEGGVGENKTFRAQIGQWKEGEFVVLKEANWGVEIIKPLLYIFQQINGNPKYIANPGDLLNWEIFFKNIGERTLENLFLEVGLETEVLDLESFKPTPEAKRIGNKVVWDYTKVSDLKRLSPMAEGKVEFWIQVKDDFPPEIKNPEIRTKISLDGFEEEISTKINSKLQITQKGYFEDEVFGNSGSIPPRVENRTTYTIIWQVKNFYNEVKNVKVKATLPSEVELTGEIHPEEQIAKFAFDPDSREIVWEVGDLQPAEEVTQVGPNVAFQIALTPTAGQRGKPAILINEARVLAEDQWTEATIERTAEAVETTLPDDPTINEQQGVVQ